MATDVCDADDTSRRSRDQDGRPSQQQAANNGQCRFHVLNISQWLERSSTAFGFFLSIIGAVHRATVSTRRAGYLVAETTNTNFYYSISGEILQIFLPIFASAVKRGMIHMPLKTCAPPRWP
jgi:hypothetical protein